MLNVPSRIIIPRSSSLDNILCILRVGFERDLIAAMGASEIEAEYLDPKVHLIIADLHPHRKFGAKVMVVGTGIAANSHGQHIPDINEAISASSPLN